MTAGDGLTEEQRRRIEQNRLEALERLKKRQERLLQEKHEKIEASISVPLTTLLQPEPPKFPPNRISNKIPKPSSFTAKRSSNTNRQGATPKEEKNKAKVTLQLDSPTTFSAPAVSALAATFRIIPGAKYVVTRSIWVFPLSQYSNLLEQLNSKNYKVDPQDQIPKSILSLFTQPTTPLLPPSSFNFSGLDPELVDALYPFQREGITRAIQRNGRVILADDMGLGKSIQALGIACFYRLEWPLLIITPASMVGNWGEQVRKWIPSVPPDRIVVAYDGKKSLTGTINITSYELAVKLVPAIRDRSPPFQVIIADECHALKNAQTRRSRALVPILTAAARAILLSGTPVLSRPLDLYPQIQAVQPKLFSRFFDYGKRYCAGQLGYFGWDFKGASNLTELQLVLERTIMIRRTKDAVLLQLPRKLRHQIFLHLSDKVLVAFKKEAKSVPGLAETEETFESGGGKGDAWLENAMKKTEYLALWKRTAQAKLPAMLEYLDDLLEAGHKMLIFAHHQEILDALEGHVVEKQIRSIRIDGKTPTIRRQELCIAFQDESSIRVAILSITAASVGLTLTAATTVVFAELFWNPGVLIQAEDRAHRIGQVDSVNVHYLLARGTTDDNIWPLILRKLNTLESVGLGKNDFGTMSKQEHDPNQLRLDRFFVKDFQGREMTTDLDDIERKRSHLTIDSDQPIVDDF